MSGQSKQRQQAARTEIDNARDWGRNYYREHPDDMLIAVARYAAGVLAEKQHQIAFLQGYIEARTHHDAFKRGE
jgi:predicted AlkP superfamily pyrophosphatase or phosphodiesterase